MSRYYSVFMEKFFQYASLIPLGEVLYTSWKYPSAMYSEIAKNKVVIERNTIRLRWIKTLPAGWLGSDS